MYPGKDNSRVTQPYAQKDAAQYPSNPGAPYRRPLAGGGGGGTPIPTPREHARPYGQGASHHLPLRRDDGYPNRGGASGSGNYGNGNGYGNGHGGGHNSRAAPVYDDDLNARPNRAGGYGAGFNDSPAPWESDRDRAVARIAQDKADREARLATEAERKRNLAKQLERDQEQKDEKKRLNKEKDREARERAKLDKGDKTKAGDARLEDDQSPFDLTSDHKGKKKDLDAPVNGFYNGKSSLPKAHKDPDAVARREAANAAELRTQPPRKKAKVKQIAIDSDSDDLDEPTSSSRKRAVADSDDDEPVKGTKQKKKMRKLGGKDDRSKGKGKSRELSVEQLTIDSSPEKPKHRSLAEHLDAKAARKAERRQAKSADLYRLDSDSDAGSSSSDSDDGEPVPHFVDPDDEELEAMLRAHREKVGRGGTPDALLDSDDDTGPTGPLCPFCAAPMPDRPSKRLLDLEQYLLARPHATKNPTRKNPDGVRLPVVETASFCRKHDEEREIIPAGREKGWPETIQWDKLDGRINRASIRLTEIIFKQVPSDFLDAAFAEWEAKGSRKMANVLSEWGSFDVEMPGYYGPRGFEAMITSLRKYLPDSILGPRQTNPLPVEAYLRRVVVPELAVMLIAEDLDVDFATARQTAIDSRAYGKAVFASSEEDDKWAADEEKREKKAAKRLEKQKADQDELDAAEERRERKRREKVEAEQGAKDALAKAIRVSKKLGDKTMDVDKPAMRVPKRRLEAQAAAAAAAKRKDDDEDSDDDAMDRIIALSKSKPKPPPLENKPAPAPVKKKAAVTIDISDGSDDD